MRWPLNGVVSDRSGSVCSSDLEPIMAVEHATRPVVGAGDIDSAGHRGQSRRERAVASRLPSIWGDPTAGGSVTYPGAVVSMSFVWWRQGAGASRVLLAGHSAVTTDVGFDGGADEQEEAVAVRPTPGQDGFGQTELGGLFDDRELIGLQGGAPLDQGMGQRQVKPEHRILRGADHRGAAPRPGSGHPTAAARHQGRRSRSHDHGHPTGPARGARSVPTVLAVMSCPVVTPPDPLDEVGSGRASPWQRDGQGGPSRWMWRARTRRSVNRRCAMIGGTRAAAEQHLHHRLQNKMNARTLR